MIDTERSTVDIYGTDLQAGAERTEREIVPQKDKKLLQRCCGRKYTGRTIMNMELLHRKVGHNFPILTEWNRRRPNMVKELYQRGELVDKVGQAAELMEDHQTRLLRAGMEPQRVQQMIKETWMMIPTEEMEPTWTLRKLM